ncbi:MAG TPA: hypothetical protein VM287_05390 [Egibacteraceae bacterium]|nr:hypothetical protein [Egibacteraceae bacterium]
MVDDPQAQKTAGSSGRSRLVRTVVVFALVVVVAALLGRCGTGIDAGPGPAVEVDQSASGDGTGGAG